MQNYPDTIFLPFNLTSGKIRNINIGRFITYRIIITKHHLNMVNRMK